jgi:hypothetical protein
MQKVKKGLYVGLFLAGALGSWIIWAISTALTIAYPEKRAIMQMLMMPASWLAILSGVVCLILIYKMWAAIQGMGARTSAGKALGFMFIPLFNLYWAFQVYWGWTKDYNRIGGRDDVELPRMPEGIALAVCVLPILSVSLLIGTGVAGGWESMGAAAAGNVGLQGSMLISLVNTILMGVLLSRICGGINALADAGLEPQRPEYAVPREDARMSGLAIGSLVLGVCGFCTAGLGGIVGLVLGIVGLRAISRSQGWLRGTGLAIAGIAVSGATLVIMPIMLAIMFPVISKAREQARSLMSMTGARQLCLVFSMYCEDNDGRLPPADSWPDALGPYLGDDKKILSSPYDRDAGRAWAMNSELDGMATGKIGDPGQTVLIYEARFNSPLAGGPELLPDKPRGPSGYVIGFVDGHVEFVQPEQVGKVIWAP